MFVRGKSALCGPQRMEVRLVGTYETRIPRLNTSSAIHRKPGRVQLLESPPLLCQPTGEAYWFTVSDVYLSHVRTKGSERAVPRPHTGLLKAKHGGVHG